MSLTDEQRAVYLHNDGPALVLAGAGSGKSHTILERASRLISEGVLPERILLTTFSKKAATDLELKAKERFGGLGIRPRTLHSLGFEIIRAEYRSISQVRFGVQPLKNQMALAKRILAEPSDDYNPYGMNWKDADLQGVLSVISTLKRNKVSTDKALEYLKESEIPFASQLSLFYKIYQSQLKYMNQVDFDDMLLLPCTLLDKNASLRNKWRVFDYIMVDEAQDSNPTQYDLIRLVSNEKDNVMWVGDDFQAIYSFTGATPDKTIYQFRWNFPQGAVYLMQNNFRSNCEIVSTAANLIKEMYNLFDKNTYSVKGKGGSVEYSEFLTPHEEAEYVVEQIKKMGTEYKFKDTAVIYRINKQSRALEDAFIAGGVPYVIYGGVSFYSRREILDVTSILKVSQSPNASSEELKRIINIPTKNFGKTTRYLGAKFIEGKERLAAKFGSFFKACTSSKLTWGQKKAIDDLKFMINTIRNFSSVYDKLNWIIENVYKDFLIKDSGSIGLEGESLLDTLEELKILGSEYGTDTEAFLNHIEEIRAADEEKLNNPDFDGVHLLTVHRSKGLEWENVFLVGVSEGLMPFCYYGQPSFIKSEYSVEEERRVCYVGVTRAKKNLNVSSIKLNMKGDPVGRSRFLYEMGLVS